MKRIGIIFGGRSSEYDVSLESVRGVIENMDPSRWEPVLIGIDRKGCWYLYQGDVNAVYKDEWQGQKECYPAAACMDPCFHGIFVWKKGLREEAEIISLDGAFPVLHGRNGEDGTVQGMLLLAGIPVIGCGVLASALSMDKDMAHRVAKEAGVLVPDSFTVDRDDFSVCKLDERMERFSYPVFVKPCRAGSSFGVTLVETREKLVYALEKAFRYDSRAVVEERIPGVEVGCAVMGGRRPLIGEVDEIELSSGFFDYQEKYTLKTSKIHVPAPIEAETARRVKETALKIYERFDCSGFARIDMFLTKDQRIYFNEVNTIPGFTAHSRFPRMMQATGYSMGEIVNRIIEECLGKER